MAKLYFRYGVMGSSKTANALMVKYNYEERGQKVLLAKPSIDTRDGEHVIKSRCGLSSDCIFFEEIDEKTLKEYSCVINALICHISHEFVSRNFTTSNLIAISIQHYYRVDVAESILHKHFTCKFIGLQTTQ